MNKTANEFFKEAFFNEEEDTAYEGDDTYEATDDEYEDDNDTEDDLDYVPDTAGYDEEESSDYDDQDDIEILHHCHDHGRDEYDISTFGMHGGPDVPDNQYNEADVERLNFLISSESDAINDYFEATTKTSDPHLSKLYGDIGHEERFHLEQLMYAKSIITGEKYTPKDPDVRKEYEELINSGMDEDNAVYTVIDKMALSMNPMTNEEINNIQQSMSVNESYLSQTMVLNDVIFKNTNFFTNEIDPKFAIYAEQVVMEGVTSTSALPKQFKTVNPIKFIGKQIVNLINLIIRIGRTIRDYISRSSVRRNEIKRWIAKNGITGIFEHGFSFYTYDDNTGRFNNDVFLKFSDLMFKTTLKIADNCGITLNANNPIDLPAYGIQPIKIKKVEEAINMVKTMTLTKTKCIINENNEDYIKAYLFGYTVNKATHTYQTTDDNGNEVSETDLLSRNGYNALLIDLDKITDSMKLCKEVQVALERMEGNPDTIYHTDNSTYNRSVNYIGTILQGFTKLVNALNADLNTMMKIDSYVIAQTKEHDDADVKGAPYKGDTVSLDTVRRTNGAFKTDDQTRHIINNRPTYF